MDAHRKRQQAQHPKLTLTDMYNVLEKLRAGEPLTAKDKTVHEQGLVSVLRQLHDELDAAVCDAYGWPSTLTDEEILARLVALNAERAAEEAQGLIRWLRPEYQAPADHASRFTQHVLIQEDSPVYEVSLETRPLLPWPDRMAEQAQAVRAALVALGGPASAAEVAAAFAAAPTDRVAELLETLVTLGQARETDRWMICGVAGSLFLARLTRFLLSCHCVSCDIRFLCDSKAFRNLASCLLQLVKNTLDIICAGW